MWQLELGANFLDPNTVRFKMWAPRCSTVSVKLLSRNTPAVFPMEKDAWGYFQTEVRNVHHLEAYTYILNGSKERPDPASRYQPRGVHGPSAIIDPDRFLWHEKPWPGKALKDLIFYEIHIGTFTPEGTFESAIQKLPYLKELGITCLELMPVAQFPGTRNWGYDGVAPYAVQGSYGGPEGLKKLVDTCHKLDLAVCLDVVYNHLGPEGNYLHDFGPYFTSKYHTPWGDAFNYDGPESYHVRRYIIDNALFWITEYHMDVLRLDAIHGIYDFSARHILDELKDRVRKETKKLNREILIIAESDLNDSRIIRSPRQGGYDLDAQWSDDFHHSIHAFLTGERKSYYQDFGNLQDIAKAIKMGFVYDGQYSTFRKRYHGNSTTGLPSEKFVVSIQNHDQVGNRSLGERLSALVPFEAQKLAAALLLWAPNTPLLFMGQECQEQSPFLYFIDHTDPELIQAVREGRKKEFATFQESKIVDPKAKKTFLASKLRWDPTHPKQHQTLLKLYKDLIHIRKNILRPSQSHLSKISIDKVQEWIKLEYTLSGHKRFIAIFSCSKKEIQIKNPFHGKHSRIVLDTENPKYGGKSRITLSDQIILAPYQALLLAYSAI